MLGDALILPESTGFLPPHGEGEQGAPPCEQREAAESGKLRIGGVTVPGRVLAAPMTGVTDLPARRIAVAEGAPYVATEMVACDAFARGRPDVVRRAAGEDLALKVIQLVGRDPKWIAAGAKLAEAAGADIIDLNFGCPCKEVTGALSGSALMREPELAERIIAAAVDATSRPVTIKMRLGWDDNSRNAPEMAERAQALGVAAITVHARTRSQFYKGAADWDAVGRVRSATTLPLIVNGDIVCAASAREAMARSGADAVMIGRGAYGRPWILAAIDRALDGSVDAAASEPALGHRLEVALKHFSDTLIFYGDALGLKIFRKHLGWYVEQAFMPADPVARRAAKARLCQIDQPGAVESALTALWREMPLPIPAMVTM
jgi:nifR3 family TIM-barrel protein